MTEKIYTPEQAMKNFIKAGSWKVASAKQAYDHAFNFWHGTTGIFWLCEKNGLQIEDLIKIIEESDTPIDKVFVDAVAAALEQREKVAAILEPHLQ